MHYVVGPLIIRKHLREGDMCARAHAVSWPVLVVNASARPIALRAWPARRRRADATAQSEDEDEGEGDRGDVCEDGTDDDAYDDDEDGDEGDDERGCAVAERLMPGLRRRARLACVRWSGVCVRVCVGGATLDTREFARLFLGARRSLSLSLSRSRSLALSLSLSLSRSLSLASECCTNDLSLGRSRGAVRRALHRSLCRAKMSSWRPLVCAWSSRSRCGAQRHGQLGLCVRVFVNKDAPARPSLSLSLSLSKKKTSGAFALVSS